MPGADPRPRPHRAHPLAGRRPPPAVPAPAPRDPAPAAGAPRLDGEGRAYITLAQFLKRHDLAPTGGAAKHLARSGAAMVNGAAEDRPGRKLHAGDQVVIAGRTLTVALP